VRSRGSTSNLFDTTADDAQSVDEKSPQHAPFPSPGLVSNVSDHGMPSETPTRSRNVSESSTRSEEETRDRMLSRDRENAASATRTSSGNLVTTARHQATISARHDVADQSGDSSRVTLQPFQSPTRDRALLSGVAPLQLVAHGLHSLWSMFKRAAMMRSPSFGAINSTMPPTTQPTIALTPGASQGMTPSIVNPFSYLEPSKIPQTFFAEYRMFIDAVARLQKVSYVFKPDDNFARLS